MRRGFDVHPGLNPRRPIGLGVAAEQSDDDLRLARTRGRCLMCCARRVRR